jgi:hypothetical protein
MAFSVRAFVVFSMLIGFSNAGAQPVLLQVKPQAGDTLRVKMEQRVDMTSCANQTNFAKGSGALVKCADARNMSTQMEVYSRAIARRSSKDATDIVAITDSVITVSPNGQRTRQGTLRAPVDLRLSSDGTVELGERPASDELRTILGQMPATLSRKPVMPGDKWLHEMRVPLPSEPGAMGRVRTTLQLDSLSKGGDVAFISMHGVLSHDHSDGTTSDTQGSLNGTMQLDRRIGWITETHATIDVWATVKNAASGKPMDVHTRVTQSLKASSK